MSLYPTVGRKTFASEIAMRKEFYDTRTLPPDTNSSIEQVATELCNAPFEIQPHQAFVRNFLSAATPYSGLLLYHGLGTGKTCTAITVAEEDRALNSQLGQKKERLLLPLQTSRPTSVFSCSIPLN